MDDERKSSKAGERAAEGLREATAKDEAKNGAVPLGCGLLQALALMSQMKKLSPAVLPSRV